MAIFGDAEAAVVAILGASSGVAAIDGVTVSTDMVGFSAPARWVLVTRTGGVPTPWMNIDNATIGFQVYANDKGTALDLSIAVRAAVFAGRGTYEGNGLALYDVADVDGLTWSPDEEDPTTPRYVFALALVTRPASI